MTRSRALWRIVWALVPALAVLWLASWSVGNIPGPNDTTFTIRTSTNHTVGSPPTNLLYQCPPPNVIDDANPEEPGAYESANKRLREEWNDFVQDFQRVDSRYNYDAWRRPYAQVKEGMHAWKTQQWKDLLQDYRDENSMLIYESAAGLGLNLLMTVQVLREQSSVPVVLYGNEYVESSVNLAHRLYATGIFPPHTSWASYCTADSRNLSHVPANTFDLVLTGYITPLQNPFHWPAATWFTDTRVQMCPNATAVEEMQVIQEFWYLVWVQQMVRIAKPGAWIWIEQVSLPFCDAGDWGGVSHDFWPRHAPVWGIEEASIVTMGDQVFDQGRYHVAFRKRPR